MTRQHAVWNADADSRSVGDQDLADGQSLRGPGGLSRSTPGSDIASSDESCGRIGEFPLAFAWSEGPARRQMRSDRPGERKTHLRGNRDADVVCAVAALDEAIPDRLDQRDGAHGILGAKERSQWFCRYIVRAKEPHVRLGVAIQLLK